MWKEIGLFDHHGLVVIPLELVVGDGDVSMAQGDEDGTRECDHCEGDGEFGVEIGFPFRWLSFCFCFVVVVIVVVSSTVGVLYWIMVHHFLDGSIDLSQKDV